MNLDVSWTTCVVETVRDLFRVRRLRCQRVLVAAVALLYEEMWSVEEVGLGPVDWSMVGTPKSPWLLPSSIQTSVPVGLKASYPQWCRLNEACDSFVLL